MTQLPHPSLIWTQSDLELAVLACLLEQPLLRRLLCFFSQHQKAEGSVTQMEKEVSQGTSRYLDSGQCIGGGSLIFTEVKGNLDFSKHVRKFCHISSSGLEIGNKHSFTFMDMMLESNCNLRLPWKFQSQELLRLCWLHLQPDVSCSVEPYVMGHSPKMRVP